jgi:iron only hydrogenase large subunit-like protein/uncharacterized Fe-S cluster-containing protein
LFTEKTECQDCYKCIRECPVKAISFENGSAEIMEDKCIYCGHCVDVCPVNAIKVRNDTNRVKQLIRLKEKVFVSLAPSYRSEFPDIKTEQIIGALKKLGFFMVSETALGAQEVSAHIAKILKKQKNNLFLSSACPTVVQYIRKYRPEYTENIINLMSPVLTHCKQLRKLYKDDIAIVFIGPCISKKYEADQYPEILNAALTFKELKDWLEEENININEIEIDKTNNFIPYSAEEGGLYPVEGGMIAGIKSNVSICDSDFMYFSGISTIKNSLNDIKSLDLKNNLFIEMMACEGGCINGPMMDVKTGLAYRRYNIIEKVQYNTDAIPRKTEIDINEKYVPDKVEIIEFDEDEINLALRRIGKFNRKDELNCGGCGYNTCREFAKALLAGNTEETMCVSYMRKMAQKKANALIKAMPSGVVIVNNKMRIIECNENFVKLMGEKAEYINNTIPGLEGANFEKLFPNLSDMFKRVLETGKDFINIEIKFGDKILNISIFTIEIHNIIGGIFQDITQPSVRKEQIIKKAKQVINKNLKTVQKIAYLLGENAAETEIILNSIIEAFSPDSRKDFDEL